MEEQFEGASAPDTVSHFESAASVGEEHLVTVFPDLRDPAWKAPCLEDMEAETVYEMLTTLAEKKPFELPASTKIELEQKGFVTSMTPEAFAIEQSRLAEIPALLQSVSDLRTKVGEAEAKRAAGSSGWRSFFTSAKNRERERAESEKAAEDAQGEFDKKAAELKTLMTLFRQLRACVETNEGFLTITDAGRDLLATLTQFRELTEGVSLGEVELAVISDTVTIATYRSLNTNDDVEREHAPALTSTVFATGKSIEEVLEQYQECDKSGHFQSYDDSPSLALLSLAHALPIAEIEERYVELYAEDQVRSGEEATDLTWATYESGKTVKEAVDYYRSIERSELLELREHAPGLAMIGLCCGLPTEKLITLYSRIFEAPQLRDAGNALLLVAACASTRTSVQEVFDAYCEILSSGALKSSFDASALAAAAIISGRPCREVIGRYRHISDMHDARP